MPVSYIEYNGKTIFFVDYRNQTAPEVMATHEAAASAMRAWREKGLLFSDFTGCVGSPEQMAVAKRLGKEVFKPKTLKSAAIGIDGVKKILLQAYNTFSNSSMVLFKTEEEAKEWLVKD